MFRNFPLAASLLLILSLFQPPIRAQVKINEVMINDYGSDDSTYVELFGPASLSLIGYQLVGVDGADSSVYVTINLSGAIPPDGFFVIGESANVPNVDLVNSLIDLQNGPDNILLEASSVIMDALGYGNFSGGETFVGEGQPAPNQPNGASLCRLPDGHDTGNNASDFSLTSILTPGTPNVVPGQIAYCTLLELRQNPPPSDEIFWTSGIASVNSNLFGGSFVINAFMQDEQAGINLYGGSFSFTLGDCLWVKAYLDDYNGLLELTPLVELNVGDSVALPDPYMIDCATANSQGEDHESMLVRLNDVWIAASSAAWPEVGQNANLTITDNSGDPLVMRIDKDTELDGWAGHPGVEQHFDLLGILSQYSFYQVLPRFPGDIMPLNGISPGRASTPESFALSGIHPNPFNASTRVQFSLAAPQRIALEVFSLNGAHIATLTTGVWPAGAFSLSWNASGWPSGIYLIRLAAASISQSAKVVLLR